MRVPASMQVQTLVAVLGVLMMSAPLCAQSKTVTAKRPAKKSATSVAAPAQDPRKAFVLDVVKSAVAVPQSDPQDQLRVLSIAIPVSNSVDPKLAHSLAEQGAQVETQVIASGQTPAASIMQSGELGCPAAQQFVDALPANAVERAQTSLVGAMQSCPDTLPSLRRKLEEALQNGAIAPRALLAAMDATGFKSEWSQQQFQALFQSLPKTEGEQAIQEAADFSTLYAQAAPQVSPELAAEAGVKLLEWANTMPQGSDRNHLVNLVTAGMRDALGEEKFRQALSANITAAQVAQTEGQPGEADSDAEENVSVLQAMGDKESSSDDLRDLPDTLRAREAAAHGFARGNDGDLKAAGQYFDVAFAALDSAWENRDEQKDASDVVQEVSEAAAQVDPLAALRRAQQLQDPSARAIAMLAVARVALNRQQGLLPLRASR